MMVTCPTCGKSAQATATQWGTRHECCGLHSWGDKPLVSPETHLARQEAHAYFDRLWHFGKMTRKEAYQRLSQEMKMPRCHISRMTMEQAREVPAAVLRIQQEKTT